MNTNKLRWILYAIVLVIVSTIGIQVYWNYKNYQSNKQQLINDVQSSLDKSVATYYENLTKKNTLGFVFDDVKKEDSLKKNSTISNIIKALDIKKNGNFKLDSINSESLQNVTIYKGLKADSLKNAQKPSERHFNLSDDDGKARFKKFKDSVKRVNNTSNRKNNKRFSDFKFLTSQVIISMSNDSIQLRDIDSLLEIELQRKALNIDYGLLLKQPKKTPQLFKISAKGNTGLSTTSKSTFLPENSTLKIYFKNETKVILKRIISGILISVLLVLAVIACLFYLLKIINRQKQLAEIKNDLINNITHEFKTPIATIGVALESINNFNVIDDKEKTKNYINLSNIQLSKLNIMVEKLLETATLDSENLTLVKEKVALNAFVEALVDKYKIHTKEKSLIFYASAEALTVAVDRFHFENAINNIIDNAIKYGGDTIVVSLKKKNDSIELNILDNGTTLTKPQAIQIFEKFYRVPKGNTHDVKGFGIGLYYTKKIIEKHQGTISVLLNNDGTTFKMTIPNEQ